VIGRGGGASGWAAEALPAAVEFAAGLGSAVEDEFSVAELSVLSSAQGQ